MEFTNPNNLLGTSTDAAEQPHTPIQVQQAQVAPTSKATHKPTKQNIKDSKKAVQAAQKAASEALSLVITVKQEIKVDNLDQVYIAKKNALLCIKEAMQAIQKCKIHKFEFSDSIITHAENAQRLLIAELPKNIVNNVDKYNAFINDVKDYYEIANSEFKTEEHKLEEILHNKTKNTQQIEEQKILIGDHFMYIAALFYVYALSIYITKILTYYSTLLSKKQLFDNTLIDVQKVNNLEIITTNQQAKYYSKLVCDFIRAIQSYIDTNTSRNGTTEETESIKQQADEAKQIALKYFDLLRKNTYSSDDIDFAKNMFKKYKKNIIKTYELALSTAYIQSTDIISTDAYDAQINIAIAYLYLYIGIVYTKNILECYIINSNSFSLNEQSSLYKIALNEAVITLNDAMEAPPAKTIEEIKEYEYLARKYISTAKSYG